MEVTCQWQALPENLHIPPAHEVVGGNSHIEGAFISLGLIQSPLKSIEKIDCSGLLGGGTSGQLPVYQHRYSDVEVLSRDYIRAPGHRLQEREILLPLQWHRLPEIHMKARSWCRILHLILKELFDFFWAIVLPSKFTYGISSFFLNVL